MIKSLTRRCAGLLVFLLLPSLGMGAACEDLGGLKIRNATLAAQSVAAGAYRHVPSKFDVPGPPVDFGKLPAYCRVTGSISPTSDSDIRFEVWLPVAGWNGKFMGVGNGGLGGTISDSALAEALLRGYATASTDTGHQGRVDTAEWAMGHPEKVLDFEHRAVHEMTRTAKVVVKAFYGSDPGYSYWNGCSTGGRQGLAEAQLHPEDYNGIIAGAPASNTTQVMVHFLWISHAIHKDPATFIPAEKLPALHAAVLQACDAMDGIKDGVMQDPRQCRFDPGQMQCGATEDNGCFTAAQIEGLRKIYAGASNPRTGRQLSPGLLMGSELDEQGPGIHWIYGNSFPPANLAHGIAEGTLRFMVYEDAGRDWRKFDFDKDVVFSERKSGTSHVAINPDLSRFKAHGGKLLQYHGWSDAAIFPMNSVNYYQSVQSRMGNTRSFYRLFMVPGMAHCEGGPGTDRFDKVSVIEQWVEQRKAPDQIIASHMSAGKVDRTRPLCPYGKVARWSGTGSTDDAANFMCAANWRHP